MIFDRLRNHLRRRPQYNKKRRKCRVCMTDFEPLMLVGVRWERCQDKRLSLDFFARNVPRR